MQGVAEICYFCQHQQAQCDHLCPLRRVYPTPVSAENIQEARDISAVANLWHLKKFFAVNNDDEERSKFLQSWRNVLIALQAHPCKGRLHEELPLKEAIERQEVALQFYPIRIARLQEAAAAAANAAAQAEAEHIAEAHAVVAEAAEELANGHAAPHGGGLGAGNVNGANGNNA